VIKKFNSTLGTFVQQSCPIYTNEAHAILALDPSGGGATIPGGSPIASLNPAITTHDTLAIPI
jgi:hypothetical protein